LITNRNSLGHKHPETIPECPDDKGIFGHLLFPLISAFEGQADVELDTGATCHLRHPVAPVNNLHDALNVHFGVKRGMQRDVTDSGSELAMRKDV